MKVPDAIHWHDLYTESSDISSSSSEKGSIYLQKNTVSSGFHGFHVQQKELLHLFILLREGMNTFEKPH